MISLILRIGNLSVGIQASFRGLEYPFHLRLPSATTFPIHPGHLFQSSPQKWPAFHRNARPTCVGIRSTYVMSLLILRLIYNDERILHDKNSIKLPFISLFYLVFFAVYS